MGIPLFDKPLSSSPAQNTLPTRRLPANLTRFPQAVYVRGEDLICPLGVGTAFGGPLDKMDAGSTASGIRTDVPGGVIGCSLPMPAARGCRGTPFPQFPWETIVQVTLMNRTVDLRLIDEGPSGGLVSKAIIDITLEGWEKLLGVRMADNSVNTWQKMVSFLIPGGAKYLGDYWPSGAVRDEA